MTVEWITTTHISKGRRRRMTEGHGTRQGALRNLVVVYKTAHAKMGNRVTAAEFNDILIHVDDEIKAREEVERERDEAIRAIGVEAQLRGQVEAERDALRAKLEEAERERDSWKRATKYARKDRESQRQQAVANASSQKYAMGLADQRLADLNALVGAVKDVPTVLARFEGKEADAPTEEQINELIALGEEIDEDD